MEPGPSIDYLSPALYYAANGDAAAFAAALSVRRALPRAPGPTGAELETLLAALLPGEEETARRVVNMAYALAAVLPGQGLLRIPPDAGPLFSGLYAGPQARQELFEILSQLENLRATCDAFPGGSFHLVKAEGGIVHFTRTGPCETADAVFNRTIHVRIEPIGQKSTEVNPFGFTITVRETGHSPDHSYYNIV